MTTSSSGLSGAGKLAWAVIATMAVLHYDFWFWDDRTLVFGFVPIGLFFQALISIGAAVGWFLVVRHAWPRALEAWAEGVDEPDPPADRPVGPQAGSGGS